MAGARVGEGIDAGEEMTQVAVSVDEPKNASLCPRVGGRHGGPAGPQVKPFKEQPPRRIDRLRIGLPLTVGGFNGVEVPSSDERTGDHIRNLRRV